MQGTECKHTVKVGEKLPNGALVLSRKMYGDKEFVLCVWKHDFSEPESEPEYVSWRIGPNKSTFYGHYGPDLKSAVEKFLARQ